MDDLAQRLVTIETLGVEQLRAMWRERFGDPPPIRARDLLRRALAERLQEEAFGVDIDLQRRLTPMAARVRPGRRPVIASTTYKSGSVLEKDWEGVRHTVGIVEGGFVWNGKRFQSLSAIARAITGVRWNGPRFFGLRPAGRT
jgi:hypothetical protein